MPLDSRMYSKRMWRAVRTLILMGSFFFLWNVEALVVRAQTGVKAYNNAMLIEALNLLKRGALDSTEADFLRAAMTTDADSAVEIYRQVVLSDPESEVAMRALDRVRQYYFAQGLYTRAEEIGESLLDWQLPQRRLRTPETTPPPPFLLSSDVMAKPQVQEEPPPEEPQPEPPPPEMPAYRFCLQVGAFSSPANAESFEDKFDSEGYNAVTEAPDEGDTLHLVKIIGYETIEEAFTAAGEIEEKFGIKPIVVPFEE